MKKLNLVILTFILAMSSYADEAKKSEPLSLFGSKPIQLEVDKNGVKQRKEPGHICELDATLGGKHYSEWGQTEEDARTIVYKACSKNSGILLCKKEKAVCRQEK